MHFVKFVFCGLSLLLLSSKSVAAEAALDQCLLEQINSPTNSARTAAEIRTLCTSMLAGPATRIQPVDSLPSQARFSEFFEPYKQSYLLFGAMKNAGGGDPFSGKTTDIRFALGMKFRLFPNIERFEALTPLFFGYSQKSWWDIAESSAPFKEHNYNPEIFWDYKKTSARNGLNFVGRIVDQIGLEHQSNGKDGLDSRSWDRIYAQRELNISDKLILNFKAWNIINLGEHNNDIADYLGNAQVKATYRANPQLDVSLSTIRGHEHSKISYQLDFIYQIPEWINSRFMLSYYEGFGEGLISYKEKTKSLRAGFYFPINFGSL